MQHKKGLTQLQGAINGNKYHWMIYFHAVIFTVSHLSRHFLVTGFNNINAQSNPNHRQ